jgi:hypothetical protein
MYLGSLLIAVKMRFSRWLKHSGSVNNIFCVFCGFYLCFVWLKSFSIFWILGFFWLWVFIGPWLIGGWSNFCSNFWFFLTFDLTN